MSTDGITARLQELCRSAMIAPFLGDNPVSIHICGRQMHIITVRDIECITHLVGIHLVLFMMQTGEIALSVVEREVQVMGIVRENRRKISPQRLQQPGISLLIQLFLEFDRQVGHQMQFVIQFQCLITVAQVFINRRAAREYDRHNHPKDDADYALHLSQSIITLKFRPAFHSRSTDKPKNICVERRSGIVE